MPYFLKLAFASLDLLCLPRYSGQFKGSAAMALANFVSNSPLEENKPPYQKSAYFYLDLAPKSVIEDRILDGFRSKAEVALQNY